MKDFITKIAKCEINIKFLDFGKLIFLLSFLPLIGAYIMEYVFGLEPCNLCFYQRIFFVAILFLALFCIFFLKNLRFKNYIIYLVILLFFANMLLSLYHVGVEQKIFELPSGCSGVGFLDMSNIVELTEVIMSKKAVRCDEPAFEFFGITLAAMNVFYCLFAVILICLIKIKIVKFKSE